MGILAAIHTRLRGEDPKQDDPRRTVLAIDDDEGFLESLRWLLTDSGFDVVPCNSGPLAIELLRSRHDIGIVLLDYHMPDLNGEETLHYIRQLLPAAKVVAMTGLDDDHLPSAYRNGVDKFLQKPCRTAQIVEALTSLWQAEPASTSP